MCLQDLHHLTSVILFGIVQIVYFTLLIAIRPFKQITNNMIEIVNELSLTGLILILVYYNRPNRWNKSIEDVFIYTIISTSSCVLFISVISLIATFAYKCCKKKSAKTEVKPFVTDGTQLNALHHNNDISQIDRDNHQDRSSNL